MVEVVDGMVQENCFRDGRSVGAVFGAAVRVARSPVPPGLPALRPEPSHGLLQDEGDHHAAGNLFLQQLMSSHIL